MLQELLVNVALFHQHCFTTMVPTLLRSPLLPPLVRNDANDESSKKPFIAFLALPFVIAAIAICVTCCVCGMKKRRMRTEAAKKSVPAPISPEIFVPGGESALDGPSVRFYDDDVLPAEAAAPGHDSAS